VIRPQKEMQQQTDKGSLKHSHGHHPWYFFLCPQNSINSQYLTIVIASNVLKHTRIFYKVCKCVYHVILKLTVFNMIKYNCVSVTAMEQNSKHKYNILTVTDMKTEQ